MCRTRTLCTVSRVCALAEIAGARLLTQLAVLNYELPQGKLQLNPTTGEIVLSIELEATEGLGHPTLRAGLDALQTTAHQVRPKLVRPPQN